MKLQEFIDKLVHIKEFANQHGIDVELLNTDNLENQICIVVTVQPWYNNEKTGHQIFQETKEFEKKLNVDNKYNTQVSCNCIYIEFKF